MWRVFHLPAYEIPETTRMAKGKPIINLLNLQKDEEISAILDITEEKNKFLFFVSEKWIVKKIDMEQVKNIRANWLKVVWVREKDKLVWVKTTTWEDNIFLATLEGKAIQFNEEDVRAMWRTAAWVKWISLKWNDSVIEVSIVSSQEELVFTITENGLWKLTWVDEYRNQKRWWSWVKIMAMTAKTWKLVSAKVLSREDIKDLSVILISKLWQTIRIPLKWIRKTSRVTQWVILTKIKWKSDMIVRASIMENEEIED